MSRIVLPVLLLASSALVMLSIGLRSAGGGLGALDTVLFWGAFLVFAGAAAVFAKAVVAARVARVERAERADEPR